VNAPSRAALAAITREIIERHDDWDSVHQFVTWHWDGERLAPGTVVIIDPAMDPLDYPRIMAKIVREQRDKGPEHPPYAFLLQIEAFGMTEPGPDATEQERAAFRAARRGRTFHEMPEAIESCLAYCADVHGRLWTAGKRRDKDGITEAFYPPGKGLSGQMVAGLLAVAYATGMVDYGLPGPGSMAN
jgi:hypothetical protein